MDAHFFKNDSIEYLKAVARLQPNDYLKFAYLVKTTRRVIIGLENSSDDGGKSGVSNIEAVTRRGQNDFFFRSSSQTRTIPWRSTVVNRRKTTTAGTGPPAEPCNVFPTTPPYLETFNFPRIAGHFYHGRYAFRTHNGREKSAYALTGHGDDVAQFRVCRPPSMKAARVHGGGGGYGRVAKSRSYSSGTGPMRARLDDGSSGELTTNSQFTRIHKTHGRARARTHTHNTRKRHDSREHEHYLIGHPLVSTAEQEKTTRHKLKTKRLSLKKKKLVYRV